MRPEFEKITTFQEFISYYWYREELIEICKKLGIDDTGEKKDLNHTIEEYYKGNLIKKKRKAVKRKPVTNILTPQTTLLDCGFCFSQKFRDYFAEQTGVSKFKFNADMVATAKKVKEEQDETFTLQDMLDLYYGKKEYAKYDKTSCQWNQFLKDFCKDPKNDRYSNKLKAASVLWAEVRNSTRKKVYSPELTEIYKEVMQELG